MIKVKRWTCIILYVGTLCVLLTSCAHVADKGKTFYGWGHAKMDAQGNVLEIESDSPFKGIMSVFGLGG